LDEVKTVLHQLPVNTPLSHVNAEHLAYLFFTSGSTGRPKAVMIEHRSPVARMYWAKEVYSDEELAGVFASTSICFDISILEIFVPLSWGGSVIVGENGLHLKSHPLASEVRLWFTVSTIAQELFQLNGIPSNLISMTIGAEPLSPSLVQALRTNTKVSRICHMYGPSEDTTLSTWGVVAGKIEKKVPIGRPISNTQIYIFDANQRPVPIGAIGEIFIGGKGLARGYYQKPIWTEERFITADDSTRLYQTGDLGRFLADGSIVFEGRKDRQIKLRGIRIELGEIEANLSAIPSVVDSVVEVVEVHNDKRLVAFLVWDQSVLYQSEQVREILAQRIPAFMVPSHFVLLESIPLKANGKINHDVLQRWSISHASAVKKETPITPLQKELSLIWEQVIGASLVGLDDNFFVLGGHSLLALKAIAMINEEFQIEISLRDIFEHPTIRQLEKVIEEKQSYQIEEQLLQEIENMSEEEVEQRLKEITENEGNNQ
jgi:amino acid adenylation domain-containing protein